MTPEEILEKYKCSVMNFIHNDDALKAMAEYSEEKDKEIAALKAELEYLQKENWDLKINRGN
jgi:hypothetical protein